MMNRMLFRALNEVTHPVRGLDIGVVEKLTQRREEAVPGRCAYRSSHEHKYHGCREHRIDRNFQGMLIERGKEAPNKSVRGECFPFAPSIHRATRGTQDEREMYRTIVGTYSALP